MEKKEERKEGKLQRKRREGERKKWRQREGSSMK